MAASDFARRFAPVHTQAKRPGRLKALSLRVVAHVAPVAEVAAYAARQSANPHFGGR